MKPGWINGIIDELRPTPSSLNMVGRALVSSLIIIVVSQTLQVPFLALSLLTAFFITQSNVVISRMVGVLFLVSATAAIGTTILILKLTYNDPLLRIVLSSGLFFLCVFLMRIFRLGSLFFIMALVVIYAQSFVDITAQAEVVIRLILWVWVAVNYAILVALFVNTELLPAEPEIQLKQRLHVLLDETRWILLHDNRRSDIRAISKHTAELHKLLHFSMMRSQHCREHESDYLALVTLVIQLYVLAHQLSCVAEVPEEHQRIKLDAACQALQVAIEKEFALTFSVHILDSEDTQTPAPLAEMANQFHIYSHRQHTHGAPSRSSVRAAPPFLTSDALSNPVYIQFAFKTLLTVLITYVFYTATGWPGIHTVMLSCLITAQPSLGATQRRAMLRIGGAAVGSLLALISVIAIIPHLDSIVGLLLLTLPVITLAAWLAASSEKISYAGIQLMFTFSLAVLESFGPVTELTDIRDRLIGIMLGVSFASIVHTLLWPEYEGTALRNKLADLSRALAAYLKNEERESLDIWKKIEESERVAARVALEPSWQLADARHDTFSHRVQQYFQQIRHILIASESLKIMMEDSSLTKEEMETVETLKNQGVNILLKHEKHIIAIPSAPFEQEIPPLTEVPLSYVTRTKLEEFRKGIISLKGL